MVVVRAVVVFDNTLISVSQYKFLMNEILQTIFSNPPQDKITNDKALARVPLQLVDILSEKTGPLGLLRVANARSCL